MKFADNISLLNKASMIKTADELSASEIEGLATLLDVDNMFTTYSEKELRSYRNPLSGQPIQGMTVNRDKHGKVLSFSFIPHKEATRVQLYEGLIFSFINPAARTLASILAWLKPSDYAKMSIRDIAAWGYVADSLVKVKDWSRHIDIVRNPGEILYPMHINDTSNLLALDAVFFSNLSMINDKSLDRLVFEDLSFIC